VILCACRFTHDCSKKCYTFITKFTCETHEGFTPSVYRPMLDSYCDHKWYDHHPIGVGIEMCIDSATHTVITNHRVVFTVNSGNWFHNSCRHSVSCWNETISPMHGVCMHYMCLHQRIICLYTCYVHMTWGRRQGPHGGYTYMYMEKYTDQEKWSVNHITYIVVYTLDGYSFVTYCDVRLHIMCITYCYNK